MQLPRCSRISTCPTRESTSHSGSSTFTKQEGITSAAANPPGSDTEARKVAHHANAAQRGKDPAGERPERRPVSACPPREGSGTNLQRCSVRLNSGQVGGDGLLLAQLHLIAFDQRFCSLGVANNNVNCLQPGKPNRGSTVTSTTWQRSSRTRGRWHRVPQGDGAQCKVR